MKKIIMIIIPIFLIMFSFGCSDNISLKGDDVVTIELCNEYIDEGINVSKDYNYVEKNNIDIFKVGSYYYEYIVYNNKGKKVADLIREVKVIDSTAPLYKEKEIDNLVVGIYYNPSYFFERIMDHSNYYLKSKKDIIFYKAGRYEVNIIIEDEYGNVCEFKREYNVIDDVSLLMEELNKENRFTRYDNGDIKVNLSDNTKDYFYFHKFNNDYIYEVNRLIKLEDDVNNLNYKYVISVSSDGLSENTMIEYGDRNKGGIYFEFNFYELNDDCINHPKASEELKEEIRNSYSLLVCYINVFSTN